MKFVATCLFGLEKFVGEQIDTLGYKRIETIDGRVIFEGDESAVARCNINFRYLLSSFQKHTLSDGQVCQDQERRPDTVFRPHRLSLQYVPKA